MRNGTGAFAAEPIRSDGGVAVYADGTNPRVSETANRRVEQAEIT